MIRVIYASAETERFDESTLDKLLAVSRKNNDANGLTGMLLYRNGDFLQILEGDKQSVREACKKIYNDKRHTMILELDESEIDRRDFGQWSMGFKRLGNEDIPEGFVDFFERSFEDKNLCARGSEALDFLISFKNIDSR